MPARVQHPAPDFSCNALVDGAFQNVSLGDFEGRYLVLFFYPLDFTFVCPTEILAFNERAEDFKALNAELVGCSIDSEYSHLAWTQAPRDKGGICGITIPLLADVTKEIARDYGVLIEDEGIALRGLFIIDPSGVVRHITINDLPIGRSVDEAIRLIQALQFHEVHGEVCPANWTPGDATIEPSPDASQAYFGQTA